MRDLHLGELLFEVVVQTTTQVGGGTGKVGGFVIGYQEHQGGQNSS